MKPKKVKKKKLKRQHSQPASEVPKRYGEKITSWIRPKFMDQLDIMQNTNNANQSLGLVTEGG